MINKGVSVILFLFSTLLLSAQINVSVGWAKDTIELGDEIDLFLFVKGSPQVELSSVNGGFLDSLISGFQTVRMREADSSRIEEFEYADAEIISYGGFSVNDDNDAFSPSEMNWEKSEISGEVLLTNKFRFRIWDPGQIIATTPKVMFTFQGQTLVNKQKFQAALFVNPPLDISSMEKDSFDIAPIKTIIKEPINWSDYRPYVIGLFGLILALLGYLFYHKYQQSKENIPEAKIEVVIPAHKIALDKLHELDEKKLWQSDIKGYQSELTYIVREYLENRFDIPALESTTDEILKAIKDKALDAVLIGEMKNILHVADLVKFAKSKPNLNIHQEFMQKAFEFVRETQEIISIIEEKETE